MITLPKKSIPYVLFQRTQYLKLTHVRLIRKLPLKILVSIESRLRSTQIEKLYAQDMENEFISIKNKLPKKVEHILDIGCGIGGIDLFLYKNLNNPHLWLLDKTGIEDTVWYGFENKGAVYNSLDECRTFLQQNAVSHKKIHTIDIDKQKFPQQKFDLIFSLISWGFHYPISTYIEDVKKSLTKTGILIVDIRKESDGEKILRDTFNNVSVIAETARSKRMMCS